MRTFDTETLNMLRVFEDITGAAVRDCIIDENNSAIVFIVEPGQMGLAIGKNGINIKMAEKFLKKHRQTCKLYLVQLNRPAHDQLLIS